MKMTRVLSLFLCICATALCFAGCASDTSAEAYSYVAMDTVFSIKCGFDSDEARTSALSDCVSLTGTVEGALSAHTEGAEVYRLNEGKSEGFEASEILSTVLSSALSYSEMTDGAFDPTIGSVTDVWNVTGGGPVPSDDAISEALLHCGTDKISTDGNRITKSDSGLMLDLGAVGKGYAAGRLCESLENAGAKWGVVSAGRTVGVFGEKKGGGDFKIGVCDPADTDAILGYVYIGSGYVSVSGDYERFFVENGVKYHHIMDPKTGRPADSGLSSVVVISPNGTAADALSTALFVMGRDKGLELYRSGKLSFEAVFIEADGSITLTDNLKSEKTFELTSDNYRITDN